MSTPNLSAWGDSWGESWGDSWGELPVADLPVVESGIGLAPVARPVDFVIVRGESIVPSEDFRRRLMSRHDDTMTKARETRREMAELREMLELLRTAA